MEACWLSQAQESQTEQIHPQTFDDPFFDSTGMIYMHWVPTGQTVNKEYKAEVLREFKKRYRRKKPALFKSAQWHFHRDNAPALNSTLLTDYLTKTGIKTVPQYPYSPEVAPCDFWLFPKLKENLRGCRYGTIEEIKAAVTKVIDMLTQEDFHGAFEKLLERYNKCIAAGVDYFERDLSFMCVLSIKVAIRKKSGNLSNDPLIFSMVLVQKINAIVQPNIELSIWHCLPPDRAQHKVNGPIKVGIRGREGQVQAEARTLLVYVAHRPT